MLSNILMNVKNVCGAQGKLEHGFYRKYLCKISILSIVSHQEVLYLFHKSRTMSGKNLMKYGNVSRNVLKTVLFFHTEISIVLQYEHGQ